MALDLPANPPIEPMLAKAVDALPDGDGWLYEPKWDGFRAIVFRDGDEVFTQSRDLKPLDRYFPELADPLRAALPDRAVVDGEVVIARDGALDFEALLLRIHPAASRVNMLAAESPASFVEPTTGTLLVRFVNEMDSASFNLGVELTGVVG